MYCNQCGKMIPEESSFCSYCGARVVKDEVVEVKTMSAEVKPMGKVQESEAESVKMIAMPEARVMTGEGMLQEQEIQDGKNEIKKMYWGSAGVGMMAALIGLIWTGMKTGNEGFETGIGWVFVIAAMYTLGLAVAIFGLFCTMEKETDLKGGFCEKVKLLNGIMSGFELGCGICVLALGTDADIAGAVGFWVLVCSIIHIVFIYYLEQWKYSDLSERLKDYICVKENEQEKKYRVSVREVRKLAPYECELRECKYEEDKPLYICKFKLITENDLGIKFEALVTCIGGKWDIMKLEPAKKLIEKMDKDTIRGLKYGAIFVIIMVASIVILEMCKHNVGSNKEPDEAVELYFAKASTGNTNAVLKVIYPIYKEIHKDTDVDKDDYYGWYICDQSFEYSDLEIEEQKIYNDGSYLESELAQLIVDANVFVDIDDYEVDKAVEYEGTVKINGHRWKFEASVMKMDGKWYVGYMEIRE